LFARIFHIFWREYWDNIKRRSYLLFTFGFPIFMIVTPIIGGIILALAIRTAMPPTDPRPIGHPAHPYRDLDPAIISAASENEMAITNHRADGDADVDRGLGEDHAAEADEA